MLIASAGKLLLLYSGKGLKISFAIPYPREFGVFLALFSKMGTSVPDINREGWVRAWLGRQS